MKGYFLSKQQDTNMIAEPNCHKRNCKYFIGVKNDGVEINERVYCKAFLDSIPNEIAYGNNKHLKPLINQKTR